MKAPERYTIVKSGPIITTLPSPGGSYISYQDYATLEAKAERLREALKQFSECNLTAENCASFEVANRRIRNLANRTLSTLENETTKEVEGNA